MGYRRKKGTKQTLFRTLPDGVATKAKCIKMPPDVFNWVKKEARERRVSANSLILDFIEIQMEAEDEEMK